MNLLVLTNNPDRPSFRQRLEVHLDLLRRNGINCEVARLPAGPAARCRLLKRSADFDAVFLHKKRLNLIEAVLLQRYSRKTIYDFDDAVMYKTVAPQRKTLCGSMRFRLTVKLADLVIAGNPYLAEHAHKFNTKVEVLPTGLNTNEYEIAATRKTDGKVRLVWIGSQSTLRYLTEITPALEEIGSRHENVILKIVCGDFIDLKMMPVEKCLWSEQTQAADLATSEIACLLFLNCAMMIGHAGPYNFQSLFFILRLRPFILALGGDARGNVSYPNRGISGIHTLAAVAGRGGSFNF